MSNLARYHGRSPRYYLSPQEDTLIRVAGPKQSPWEEPTAIKNVSLSGLAFTAPVDLCPTLGEVIKIQFTPPGGEQLASYGVVTRLENYDHFYQLVGIQFYKMEMGHRMNLAQTLTDKLKKQKLEADNSVLHFSFKNMPSLITLIAVGATYLAAIWGLVSLGKYLPHFLNY